jgi:hypothetical protein
VIITEGRNRTQWIIEVITQTQVADTCNSKRVPWSEKSVGVEEI